MPPFLGRPQRSNNKRLKSSRSSSPSSSASSSSAAAPPAAAATCLPYMSAAGYRIHTRQWSRSIDREMHFSQNDEPVALVLAMIRISDEDYSKMTGPADPNLDLHCRRDTERIMMLEKELGMPVISVSDVR